MAHGISVQEVERTSMVVQIATHQGANHWRHTSCMCTCTAYLHSTAAAHAADVSHCKVCPVGQVTRYCVTASHGLPSRQGVVLLAAAACWGVVSHRLLQSYGRCAKPQATCCTGTS